MHIKYEQIDTLPRLAWCAHVTRHDDTVIVRHGPRVETREVFFCEGAWNGEFEHGSFEQATSFMGSGGALHEKGIVFVTPTHFLEQLYLVRNKEKILVSNSLAFVIAEANDYCDPSYYYYIADLIDFHNRGLSKTHTSLPTLGNSKVHLYQRCNVVITPSLTIRTVAKKSPGLPPGNYMQYRNMLKTTVSDINNNALSALRKRAYTPLATISSGYDSTACAVLAREIGCTEAVTLSTAREDNPWGKDDLDDSGKEIGETIGLTVTEYDRTEYLRRDNFPEAEFLAYGSGEDINMLGMEDAFVDRMVFTGARGDFVWERLGFSVPWNSVVSFTLTEFRLRTGYIHIPPCAIAEEHHKHIRMISNSREMESWSIGDIYDRPIPRRIGEEAGIARNLFGLQKKATSINMRWGKKEMTEASACDFTAYINSVRRPRSLLQRALFVPNKLLFKLNLGVNHTVSSIAKHFGKELTPRLFVPQKYRLSPSLANLTFHWGHEKIRNRYEKRDRDS